MHKFRSIPTKKLREALTPDTLQKYNTLFFDENVHAKPINKMSTKKNTNGRIASVVPSTEQESTEKAEKNFEDYSREDKAQKIQTEQQSDTKNTIEVDLSDVYQAGKNDINAWWRCNKAELFSKKFGGLHSAVAEESPPQLLYPKEHCSMTTYTSRSTPADLLVSLCLATVCADVTVSNTASLLAGDCWVIQGFFFAMFLRTTVNIAIFSQEDDEDLLVEMHCVQGDRGAFHKLCEYIVQRCDLRHIADSDPITVSNATRADDRCHSTSLEPMQEYKTLHFENEKDEFVETKVTAKRVTNKSRCGAMPNPTRSINTAFPITIPGSPLRLHSHDSYTPTRLPEKKLAGFVNEDNNTRQMLRMLVKRQAECYYHESKMMFWRQIASLTMTDSIAAHELLVMCVEGCCNDDDTNVLGCIKKELSVDMCGMFDLQYCVLAALFHAVQTNQRVRVPLPLPLLHPTVWGPLSDVVSQATKFTADHHDNHLRVYALGLVSWLTSQQVAASVSCGATLPIKVSESVASGLKT